MILDLGNDPEEITSSSEPHCTDSFLETATFAVADTTYEIDLSKKNASSLRNDVAAWVRHARTITGP